MHAYTVLKPRAIREQEYHAYTGLLEGIGIDINDVPRTPEPSTKNRWLYVWSDRNRADRFAPNFGGKLMIDRGPSTRLIRPSKNTVPWLPW